MSSRAFRSASHRRLRGSIEPADLPKALRTKLRAIQRSIKALRGESLSSSDAFAAQKKIQAAIERFEKAGRSEGYLVYDIGRVLWRDVADAKEDAQENHSRALRHELHESRQRARAALPVPGTYEYELALMKGGTGRGYARDARRRGRHR